MATLIPDCIATAYGDTCYDPRLADVRRSLPEDTWVWHPPQQAETRPRFVVLSPTHGVVGIEVYDWGPDEVAGVTPSGVDLVGGGRIDPAGELGQKLEQLRSRLPATQNANGIDGLIGGVRIAWSIRKESAIGIQCKYCRGRCLRGHHRDPAPSVCQHA